MAQQGEDVTALMNQPQSGEDVTDLMNAPSGEDVTSLMNQEEQPGILGKAWDWMTTSVDPRYKNVNLDDPRLPLTDRFFSELTKPITIIGELAGGAGAIAGLRKFTRLGKLGKAAPKTRGITSLLDQKAPLGARSQIFPEPTVKLPARDKLRKALEESGPLNEEQKAIYAKGIREKVAKREEVTAPGVEGFRQRRAALAGKYEKVEIRPLSETMSEGDLNGFIDEIEAFPDLMPLQRDNAAEGMLKLYNGNVPQPNEIKLLRKVFGDEIDEQLINLASKKPTVAGRVGKIVGETLSGTQDLMRAILTSYDLSPVGRQGRMFISYPEYWKAFPTMVKSWGKDFFDANQAAIKSHPNFTRPRVAGQVTGKSIAERGGLDLTDLTTNREEIFLSKIALKIPGIPASNRAYVGFLNKLRSDMFNRLVKETGGDILNNDVKLKAIGKLINNATGRGKLPGMLEDNARLMNQIFFAPRLHAGKIRMYGQIFNPKFYTEIDPVVRKATLRSLITSTSFSVAVGSLFAQMGAEVSNDPTSSDFRKIKIDGVRIDLFGGDQQYAVAMAKLLTGKSTSSTSGKVTDIYSPGFGEQSAGGVMADFLANRLAPIPSMAVNLLFNRSYGDENFGIMSELADKTVPIMVQDILEIMEQDPGLWPALIPAALGVGLQAYGR